MDSQLPALLKPEREEDPVDIWLSRQRRIWWQKYRGAIIPLIVANIALLVYFAFGRSHGLIAVTSYGVLSLVVRLAVPALIITQMRLARMSPDVATIFPASHVYRKLLSSARRWGYFWVVVLLLTPSIAIALLNHLPAGNGHPSTVPTSSLIHFALNASFAALLVELGTYVASRGLNRSLALSVAAFWTVFIAYALVQLGIGALLGYDFMSPSIGRDALAITMNVGMVLLLLWLSAEPPPNFAEQVVLAA